MKKTEHQIIKFESKFFTKKLRYFYDNLEKTHFMLLFILIELAQLNKKVKFQILANSLTSQLNCDIRTIKKGLDILETEYHILIYNDLETYISKKNVEKEISIYKNNINYLKKIKKLCVGYKNKKGTDIKIVPEYKKNDILRFIKSTDINNSEYISNFTNKTENLNYEKILLLIDNEIKCIEEENAMFLVKLKTNKKTKKYSIEFQEHFVEIFGLLDSNINKKSLEFISPYLILFRELPVFQRILILFILEVFNFLVKNINKEYNIPAKLSLTSENGLFEIIINLEFIAEMINYDISHLRKTLYEIENGNDKDKQILKFHYNEIQGFVSIQIMQPLIEKQMEETIKFFEKNIN